MFTFPTVHYCVDCWLTAVISKLVLSLVLTIKDQSALSTDSCQLQTTPDHTRKIQSVRGFPPCRSPSHSHMSRWSGQAGPGWRPVSPVSAWSPVCLQFSFHRRFLFCPSHQSGYFMPVYLVLVVVVVWLVSLNIEREHMALITCFFQAVMKDWSSSGNRQFLLIKWRVLI